MSEDANPKACNSANKIVVKKKQPAFWEREIKVTNANDIDQNSILTHLQTRFRSGFEKWRKQAKLFRAANMCVTVLIILLQLTQDFRSHTLTAAICGCQSVTANCHGPDFRVVAFQLPNISLEVKTTLATVLPAVSGAVLALQLKLNWAEKGTKCKKAAKMYKKLGNHVEYRLKMAEAGGQFSDASQLWNLALHSEIKEVPVFLSVY